MISFVWFVCMREISILYLDQYKDQLKPNKKYGLISLEPQCSKDRAWRIILLSIFRTLERFFDGQYVDESIKSST